MSLKPRNQLTNIVRIADTVYGSAIFIIFSRTYYRKMQTRTFEWYYIYLKNRLGSRNIKKTEDLYANQIVW